MRAAVYVRVSVEQEEHDGTSLSMQEQRCRAFCEAKGWDVLEIVTDNGQSGRSLNRPGIEHILQIVTGKQRTLDAVVILKLDRLTRNVSDLGRLLGLFEKHRVALAGPELPFDTTTSAGRLMANLLTSMAQWEREQIGERTKAVLRHRKDNGLVYAPQPPFGYRQNGKCYVDAPDEQATISRMVTLSAKGFSLREIAQRLNDGDGTHPRNGKAWYASTVRTVLKRQGTLSATALPSS
jgi:site-specific DNA recombinase